MRQVSRRLQWWAPLIHVKIEINHPTVIISGFVNMCVEHIRSPLDNAKTKVDHIYTGPNTSKIYDDMINCDQEGLLMVSVVLCHL